MTMKLFNTLDEIYSGEPYASPYGYRCPVCSKDFRTVKGVERHFAKRNCHKLTRVFKNTEGENTIYSLYRKLCRAEKRFPYKLENFRDTRFYTIIGKFVLFCYSNTITDMEEYLFFVIRSSNPDQLIKGAVFATNERMLKRYREWKIHHVTDDQSRRFYNLHSQLLKTDINFVLRALEKGEISTSYYFSKISLFDFYDKLSDAQKYRFENLLKRVEASGE